ncbi:synaptobrevin-like protein, possible [Cryptosporidium parvum Iowa II]|uniref:Synaptobrevin-like protein, possible n=2 Tax=Cryptosporidium parvum TaxID=5807 RepID=A3FQR3_CRYPI|nr:synaptobrevin-like protein, possible [Cryptosporidium parvum Iowa II]EAZ51205.1 synaptobrevin-like protein, possible [Cryptosporidium parvum Iowa II]CAD98619.1 synaptobrevin-like protein, possible [Cryptosporidium parvum]
MSIIYSLVAKDNVVLAEYTENTGNFPSIARFLLKKINKSLNKQSYTYDIYCFHFLIYEPGVIYMAMTDRSFGLTIPYEYLLDIRSKTLPFVEMLTNPITLILNGVIYWNCPENTEYDMLANQISTIQNVLIENIDILLERGEKLDLLVSQAKNLTMESNTFRRQSYRLQQSAEWLPIKRIIMLFLAGTFILSIYIILAFNCGGLFLNNCIHKFPNNYIPEPFINNNDDDKFNEPAFREVDEFINELNTKKKPNET